MRQPFLHDQYAPLSHIDLLGDGTTLAPGLAGVVATWVPYDDNRRLRAYEVLAAYRDNVRRHYLPDAPALTVEQALAAQEAKKSYREYGHTANLVAQARATVLGESQTIVVPAASTDDTEDQTSRASAVAALNWLNGWAGREQLWLKMLEAETDAVGLGDTVYALGWDPIKGRPKLRTYDPGWYFPVLSDDDPDDFPRTVHIAWEERVSVDLIELHRLTWQMGPIRPAVDVELSDDVRRIYAYTEQGLPVPQDGDKLTGLGVLARRYPWDPEHDSTITCHFTHAVYDLSKIKGDLFDLRAPARYARATDGTEQRDLDLRLDFVPVVHEPNTPAGKEHFGRATPTLVAQVLDDLAQTDTDLANTGALAGSPPLVTKGMPGTADIQGGPGLNLNLEAGSSAAYLDTSKNLDALLKLLAKLEKTLSVNSRFAQAILGRVDASDVPSGYALDLSFQPTRTVVGEMRMVRAVKHALILKFALRMAQNDRQLAAGPTPTALVQLGEFIPPDLTAEAARVVSLIQAKIISLETGLRILIEAGFPIEDVAAEIARVHAEDIEGAGTLLDVTGDEVATRKRLGLDPTAGA